MVLGAFGLGLFALDANGLSSADSFTDTPDSVVGQRVQGRYVPAGGGQPLVVVARAGAIGVLLDTFGVLLDTFVVRSVLASAITLDPGRRVWWPSRLDAPGRSEVTAPARGGEPAERG